MMAGPAFLNDPVLKATAIADAAGAVHPGWTNVADEEDRQACGRAFGLSPNLVTLLSVASNAPYWDGSSAFVADCVAAVPMGADDLSLARRWALSRWTEGEHAIEPRLSGTAAHEAAREVFAAAAEAAGAPIPRQVWRRLRARLAAIEDLSEAERAWADVAAALAWDETAAPGVHADVWKSWQEAIRIEVDHGAGWSQAIQNEVFDALRDATVKAHATISPRFGGTIESEEASAAHAVEVSAIMSASPLGPTLDALTIHWRDHVTPVVAAARSTGLASIRAACGADESDARSPSR